jgi:DNA-binding transcriptional LysR family regulator
MPPIFGAPWLGVEPRHLATFVTVVEEGSFRRAAPRLGYAQSAISQQIALLEQALQTRLLERGQGNRRIELTDAGQALLHHAGRVVDQLRAARADVVSLARGEPVRIAVEPAATGLLSTLVSSPAAEFGSSDRTLSVRVMPAAAQIELLAKHEIDLALGCFADLDPELACRVIHTDEWVLVAAATGAAPLLAPTVTPALLHGLRVIEERAHPLPFGLRQLGTTTIASCDQIGTALELVRAGAGCAILPGLAVDRKDRSVRVLGLGDLLPARTVSVIWCRRRRLPEGVSASLLTTGDDARRAPDALAAAA